MKIYQKGVFFSTKNWIDAFQEDIVRKQDIQEEDFL